MAPWRSMGCTLITEEEAVMSATHHVDESPGQVTLSEELARRERGVRVRMLWYTGDTGRAAMRWAAPGSA